MIFSFFSPFSIYHIKYPAPLLSEQGSVAFLKKRGEVFTFMAMNLRTKRNSNKTIIENLSFFLSIL